VPLSQSLIRKPLVVIRKSSFNKMQSITEEIKENLKATVARFTEPTIGDESPKNLCFCTCFPLLLFLKTNNINCSLTGGDYNGIRHFWLTVNGYDNVIIDPTIRQFKTHFNYKINFH